jgi:hypothetical protein
MAFWSNANIEPKRSHRFLFEFTLPDGTTSQVYARNVSKPSFDIGQSEHKFLGQTYYYPSAISWSDVSATLVNSMTPDFDALMHILIANAGYVSPDNVSTSGNAVDDGGTISKGAAVAALGPVLIKELDGDGRTVGEYKLNNAWVKSASFGDLDYGSEELQTLSLTLRYDWASYSSRPGVAIG